MNVSVTACVYRYFKQSCLDLTETGQDKVSFLKLPLVTLSFMLQHKQWDVRCYWKCLGWLALTYACSRCPVSEVPRLLRPLHMSPVTATNFSLGSYEKFQPGFRDELKANDPGDEFRHKGTKKADMRNTKIITFAPIIAFATLEAVSLQLIAMLMMRKIQQAIQDDAIWARIHPAFIPVTGLKSHVAKFPAHLPKSRLEKNEISGTEPACPVIWTHRGRDKARSRKPGSYEEDLKKIWPAIDSVSTRIKRYENRNTGSNPDFSYPNRSPLPLHYHTAPSKFRKNLSTYTSKLSFLTVTSRTADPSPFHNF